jgi:ATP-dependent exoDNAse (exonuclease V) alpha subunit
MTTLTLTQKQEEAVNGAVSVIHSPLNTSPYTIGGYAGTGKSTILNEIVKRQPHVIACAYTGKAASVMRSKGVAGASTIHSAIYRYDSFSESFVKKNWGELEGSYFLIDEASMVGGEMWRDILSFNVPVVLVGDHGQLPPISKSDPNLLESLDVELDQIHRQAEGNEILDLATHIREGGNITGWRNSHPPQGTAEVQVLPKGSQVTGVPDVFICGYNKTRVRLNQQTRQILGREGKPFVGGERIVCLRNDKKLNVFNGMMGTLTGSGTNRSRTFHDTSSNWDDDDSTVSYRCRVLWDGFDHDMDYDLATVSLNREKTLSFNAWRDLAGEALVVDYAYAVTCHKAQGSSFPHVVVFNEEAPSLWDQSRWLYTAITRAEKTVCVFA